MADDKEAVWTKIELRQPPEEIVKFSPMISLRMARLDPMDCMVGPVSKVIGLLDSGASIAGLEPEPVKRLGLERIREAVIHEAGRPPIETLTYRVRLSIGSLSSRLFATGLLWLGCEYNLIVGRNVLANCRVDFAFTSGQTTLWLCTA
jgi:hypothetical protein